jgi:hypothetical protein
MGMIRSSITVLSPGEAEAAAEAEPGPVPAGVTIPVDEIALGAIIAPDDPVGAEKGQRVGINLRDDGFSPALIVLDRNVPTLWTNNNDSLEPGNAALLFPAYQTAIPMRDGDNVLELLPTADFEFSTADNVYYGFVKVVDNMDRIDPGAIKEEAAAWETQVYPDGYFAEEGRSCCAP